MNFRHINTKNVYPYDLHLIEGLRENGHSVSVITENAPGYKKYFNLAKLLFKERGIYDATFIGFPSPLFAIIAGLAGILTGEKVIFNGIFSQYEANVVSRDVKRFSFEAFKYWLIDVLSFHLPWRTVVESNSQKEYIRKLVGVPEHKLIRSWAGVNEKEFFIDPSVKKLEQFTVLFRGKFLPESGILTIIKAAHLLEGKDVRINIIGEGFLHKEVATLIKELKPSCIEIMEGYFPTEVIRQKMLQSHVSLGQLADHPRLERTLPCKLFESLALGLPYLTGRNKGALELLTENETCLCANPGDEKDLAEKILLLKKDSQLLQKLAKNGFELYQKEFTSKHLAAQLLEELF